MAETLLESSAVSAFCGGVGSMLSAGIQVDEATHLLSAGSEDAPFRAVCADVYQRLNQGDTLADAMRNSGAFPKYACDLIETGELSGHTEEALASLVQYYDEEDRMFTKLQSSVRQPAALLCVMSVVLAFTVVVVLPVFVNVYRSMAGTITNGSYGAVGVAIAIGWIVLIVTIVVTILVLAVSAGVRTQSGRERLLRRLGKLKRTRQAVYQLDLARFSMALSANISSGITSEAALKRTMEIVDNDKLKARIETAYKSMNDISSPKSLMSALADADVYDPFYSRMLLVGERTADTEAVLSRCSEIFFDDALDQIDRITDNIQPALAILLSIAVGATLVAVMLPLIGIMQSIG